jgi:hypothetical protein
MSLKNDRLFLRDGASLLSVATNDLEYIDLQNGYPFLDHQRRTRLRTGIVALWHVGRPQPSSHIMAFTKRLAYTRNQLIFNA